MPTMRDDPDDCPANGAELARQDVFVAGDSEGDMNMMQDFADTKLVLIVNRLKGKDIDVLSKQAVASYGKPDAKVLLQGRNDNTGQFEPSQAHTKFGAKTGQVLK